VAVQHRAEQIHLLNQDLQGEHAAIVQYLPHAWVLSEVYGPAIETIAREEMRHMKWLAHTIVRLGGVPDLSLSPEPLPAQTAEIDLIIADIAAEESAIEQYEEHRRIIPNAQIDGLFSRILIDERDHRRQFENMAEQWTKNAGQDQEPDLIQTTAYELRTLVYEQYWAILAMLAKSFDSTRSSGIIADDPEEQAIDMMKHLGWLGEYLAHSGQRPAFPKGAQPLAHPPDTGSLWKPLADQALGSDRDLAAEVSRIQRHEVYLETAAQIVPGLTIGSLRPPNEEEVQHG
jgi:bacterioferritin